MLTALYRPTKPRRHLSDVIHIPDCATPAVICTGRFSDISGGLVVVTSLVGGLLL